MMIEISSDNKRIIKNTILLYIRMLLVMIVSLYTVRVVLSVLGEEDYGIYNVVGGVVIMFSFLSRTLASGSQRYFAFELGRKDYVRLNDVFCVTVYMYLAVCIIIIVLAETIGLWFIHNKMTIPHDRMNTVNWIYQFSIVSFCVSIIATPYQAVIIAREEMGVYAFAGILEVLLALVFAYLLRLINYDSLLVYGLFMLLIAILVNSIYVVYALRKYKESKLKRFWEGRLAKEIFSYSGWNLYGAVANVVRDQGVNLLINVFFTPVINAARGLANQVNNALSSFAFNFYTAVRPQVTKNYAKGDIDSTMSLVFSSSKLSFYLILFIAVPVMVFANPVLELWLEKVPDYTVLFMRLSIIVAMVDSISNPLMTLVQATGKVKKYQLVIGTLLILNLPFSWLLLVLGFSPEYTMYVAIVVSVLSLLARLFILKGQVQFPVKEYCIKVLIVLLYTSLACFSISICVDSFLYSSSSGVVDLLFNIAFSIILCCIAILVLGFSKEERAIIIGYLSRKLHIKNSL